MTEQAHLTSNASSVSTSLATWINLFRWMASSLVLMSHIRHRLFVPIYEVPAGDRSITLYVFSAISSLGHPAVIFFFVASGFLVGGSSLRRFQKVGFDIQDYALTRLTRLWVVLIPALFVTLILNYLGLHVFNGDAVGIYVDTETGAEYLKQDPLTLLCNIAFLQTVACNQFGHNGALWSLFNEFWYYAAWPAVMLAVWGDGNLFRRIGILLAAVSVLIVLGSLQFIGPNVALYFTIWLVGVVVAARQKPFVKMPVWVAGLIFIAVVGLWRVTATSDHWRDPLVNYPKDLLIALFFANLLMNMKAAKKLAPPPFKRLHDTMAGFSFTVFAVHTPAINMACAFFMWSLGTGWDMTPVGALPFVLFVATALFCYVLSYAVSLVAERHTVTIREYVRGKLGELRKPQTDQI